MTTVIESFRSLGERFVGGAASTPGYRALRSAFVIVPQFRRRPSWFR